MAPQPGEKIVLFCLFVFKAGDNTEKCLHDFRIGNVFFNKIQRVLAIKQKINKLDYKKI